MWKCKRSEFGWKLKTRFQSEILKNISEKSPPLSLYLYIIIIRRGNFPWKRGGRSCLENWSQKTETRGSKFAEDCAKYGGDEERGVATPKGFASGENKSEISAIRARKSFEHVSEITKSYLGQLFWSNFHLASVCNPSISMIIKDKYLPFLIATCILQTSLAKVGGQRSINIGAHPKNPLTAKASNRA